MKKFITISVVLFLAIFVFFVYKLSYIFRVDDEVREEIGKILLKGPPLAQEIYRIDPKVGETSAPDRLWGEQLIKIQIEEAENILNGYRIGYVTTRIMRSADDGVSWEEFKTFEGGQCWYLYIYNNKLYCIDPPELITVVDITGRATSYNLFPKTRNLSALLAIIKKSDNELYFVWADERARIVRFKQLLDLYSGAGDPYWGPYVVIAGKVNLDTLETDEHIIQYGPYWVGFIYDNKVWRWLTIQDDGTSLYPQPLQ